MLWLLFFGRGSSTPLECITLCCSGVVHSLSSLSSCLVIGQGLFILVVLKALDVGLVFIELHVVRASSSRGSPPCFMCHSQSDICCCLSCVCCPFVSYVSCFARYFNDAGLVDIVVICVIVLFMVARALLVAEAPWHTPCVAVLVV